MELLPDNALENALVNYHNQSMDLPDFINTLINESVAILAQKQPDESAIRSLDLIHPLIIQGKSKVKYVVAFSSPERTNTMQEYFEDYPVMFTVDSKALLSLMPENLGLVINPGFDVYQSLGPEVVNTVRHELRELQP